MSEPKYIEVGGRIHSIATGNVTTGANEIFDDDKNKKQNEINTETYSLVNNINERLNSLSPDQQSALSVATKAINNETKLGYYVCETEGNVAAKVIAPVTGYVLSTGGSIKVKMTNANTAADATLNINSTGAKALYYDGERVSTNNSWEAGETVEIYYDGTSYYANNVAGGGIGDGVFDVSVKYPTSGIEGGNTYTLQGALAVLNDNLSANKKKGGMSIKFIQSSDNKYVQFRYMSSSTAVADFTNVANWQGVDDEPTAGSQNLVKSGGVAFVYGSYIESPEWLFVLTDNSKKILFGVHKTDGSPYFGYGCPPQVVKYVTEKLNTKVDKLSGKSLIDEEVAASFFMKDNDEYLFCILDNNKTIAFGIKRNGDIVYPNSSHILKKKNIYKSDEVNCSDMIPSMRDAVSSYSTFNLFPKNDLPCVSFRFDDCPNQDKDVVHLFNKYNARCGFAFIASDDNMTKKAPLYLAWNKLGYSMICHSLDGKGYTYANYPTVASAKTAIMTSFMRMKDYGMSVNSFSCPDGDCESEYIPLFKNVCAYAYTTHGAPIPTRNDDACNMESVGVQGKSLQEIKDIIDNAVTNNLYLSLYGHAANFGTTYSGTYNSVEWEVVYNIDFIESILQYIYTKRNNGDLFFGSPDECAKYFFKL